MPFVLPSRKIMIMGGACILILGAIIFRSQIGKNAGKSGQNGLLSALPADSASLDSDHDGLKDWEEALWGTDPHNPDSDGDGISDSQEVAMGRNPTGPGLIANAANTPPNKGAATSTDAGLNATDIFSRGLLSQYAAAKASGATLDAAAQAQIVDSYSQIALAAVKPAIYSQKDLKITPETARSLHDYGNRLAGIFLTDNSQAIGNELVIFEAALEQDDPTVAYKLHGVSLEYDVLLQEVLALQVPAGLAGENLKFANALSGAAAGTEAMSRIISDPITGASGMSLFQASTDQIRSESNAIGAALKAKGATFAQDEYGYALGTAL